MNSKTGNERLSRKMIRKPILTQKCQVTFLRFDYPIDARLSRIPNAASLYLSRGLLHAKEAEYDKAEADFARAGQLDATQSMSSYAADLAEMQKNNPREALSWVQQQLRAHPDSALLHFLLAKLKSRTQDAHLAENLLSSKVRPFAAMPSRAHRSVRAATRPPASFNRTDDL